MVTIAPNVCGRPDELDVSNYQQWAGSDVGWLGTGDNNYGYVVNPNYYGVDSITLPKAPPQGGTWGDITLSDLTDGVCSSSVKFGCNLTGPSGRNDNCGQKYMPASCFYSSDNNINVPVQKNNWDAGVYSDQETRMKCCSAQLADSSHCAPDLCPQNNISCQATMESNCTPDGWGGVGVYSNYSDYCDTYFGIQTQAATSTCPDNPSVNTTKVLPCDQRLVASAVNTMYTGSASATNKQFPAYLKQSDGSCHPFVNKAVNLCRLYPGLCDDMLTTACKGYKAADLSPDNWKGRQGDFDGTALLRTCGCFLPDTEYPAGVSKQCAAICSIPGQIPTSEQCTDNKCLIDDLTINIVNSTAGSVNITQTCGQCDSKNPCECYFGDDVTINQINSDDVKKVINLNCSTCYTYTNGDISNRTQWPCKTGPPPPTPTPTPTPTPSPTPTPTPTPTPSPPGPPPISIRTIIIILGIIGVVSVVIILLLFL